MGLWRDGVITFMPREEVERRIRMIAVGRPVPLDKLTGVVCEGLDHWLELCKRIPKGMAQEVKVPPEEAERAIRLLMEFGALPKEYVVRVYKSGGRERTYIVRVG